MRNNPKPYLWLTGSILVLLVIGIVVNKHPAPAKPEKIFVERKTPHVERQETKKVASEFVMKYAGEYSIGVDDFYSQGKDEKLFLHPTGECEWRWFEGGRVQSIKSGYWTAEKGKIFTVIKGNAGDIPEDFTFENGKFRNGHRFLNQKRKL